MRERTPIPAIVVTGPVGAGKSTTMDELSRLLGERDIPHVVFDMDYLRWVVPHPEGDPFAACLGYRNLAAIWPNVAALGVACVLIADVVESRGQVREYEAAMPGTTVTVVRLDVPLDQLERRLHGRETGHTIAWYLNRAPELQRIMEREGIGDVVVDVGGRDAADVAREIIAREIIARAGLDGR